MDLQTFNDESRCNLVNPPACLRLVSVNRPFKYMPKNKD